MYLIDYLNTLKYFIHTNLCLIVRGDFTQKDYATSTLALHFPHFKMVSSVIHTDNPSFKLCNLLSKQ